MPSDGKKFERIDEISDYRDVPEAENYDGHCNDLQRKGRES